MDFFSGFKWAVPMAFSDSLAQTKFVEGDVLYDCVDAYNNEWRIASQALDYAIQVRSPARSSEENFQSEGKVFSVNWDAEVKIDLYKRMKPVNSTPIRTTQGRLFTTLWQGQIDTLFEEKSSNPLMPTTAQKASKNIEEVRIAAIDRTQGLPAFVMVRELTNSVSRAKYQKILTQLRPYMNQKPIILSPSEAQLTEAEKITPTVDIAIFPTSGIQHRELEALIKKAVYAPSKGSDKDMYKLKAHGIVV